MSRPESNIRVQATVGTHGSLTIDRLPFKPGQRVHVMISPVEVPPAAGTRYPLAGMKVEYPDPFGRVAEGDWEPPVIVVVRPRHAPA